MKVLGSLAREWKEVVQKLPLKEKFGGHWPLETEFQRLERRGGERGGERDKGGDIEKGSKIKDA